MDYLKENESFCLGMSLTLEALKHRPDYLKSIVLSTKANRSKEMEYMLSEARENRIPVLYDDRIIDKYSIKENCYCIGFFKRFQSSLKTGQHILLYRFSDYGQLGTVLRSAVSFDFHDIVLIDSDIDYFDPRSVRASMGAIFHLNIESYKTVEEYQKRYTLPITAFVNESKKELQDLKLSDRYALLIPSCSDLLNNCSFDSYYIKHHEDELPLSALASIVFNYCFEKR